MIWRSLSASASSHKNLPPPSPMPTLTPLKRNWGKVDKAALLQLIVDGKVDIEDHSYENIDADHERWFSTHLKHNFWRILKITPPL